MDALVDYKFGVTYLSTGVVSEHFKTEVSVQSTVSGIGLRSDGDSGRMETMVRDQRSELAEGHRFPEMGFYGPNQGLADLVVEVWNSGL